MRAPTPYSPVALPVYENPKRVELKAVMLAGAALAMGAAVYLLVRGPESLHFSSVVGFPSYTFRLADYAPPYLLPFFGSLPSGAHAFAFSLLTAVVLGFEKTQIAVACLTWSLIGTAFEFLQLATSCPTGIFPQDQVPGQFFCNYIVGGVFDWLDVTAILVGAGLAYLVSRRLSNVGRFPVLPGRQ